MISERIIIKTVLHEIEKQNLQDEIQWQQMDTYIYSRECRTQRMINKKNTAIKNKN